MTAAVCFSHSYPQFALLFKLSRDKIWWRILSPNKMPHGCSGNCFSRDASAAIYCVKSAATDHWRHSAACLISWSDWTCLTLFPDAVCAHFILFVHRSLIKQDCTCDLICSCRWAHVSVWMQRLTQGLMIIPEKAACQWVFPNLSSVLFGHWDIVLGFWEV